MLPPEKHAKDLALPIVAAASTRAGWWKSFPWQHSSAPLLSGEDRRETTNPLNVSWQALVSTKCTGNVILGVFLPRVLENLLGRSVLHQVAGPPAFGGVHVQKPGG